MWSSRLQLQAVVIVGLLGMFVAGERPVGAQPPEKTPSGKDFPLARAVQQVRVGRVLKFPPVVVAPLFFEQGPTKDFLAAPEALEKKLLQVQETGSVPVLQVRNLSQKHVFIPAGQVFSGGKQTRTIAQDVVLAPGEKTSIRVFCVEQGRWSGGRDFYGAFLATPAIRGYLFQGANQAGVWHLVATQNADLGVASKTGSLEDSFRHPEVKDIRKSLQKLQQNIPREAAGVLVLWPGGMLVELFGGPELARPYLTSVVETVLVEQLARQRRRKSSPVRQKKVPPPRELLARIAALESRGKQADGQSVLLESKHLVGTATFASGRLLHLFAVSKRSTEQFRQKMPRHSTHHRLLPQQQQELPSVLRLLEQHFPRAADRD